MAQARLSFTVTEQDTARALGSGDVEVLATPRLLAWCEAATCVVASEVIGDAEPVVGTVAGPGSAGPGSPRTSVGTRVALDHLAASAVGQRVHVEAVLTEHRERVLDFSVSATDDSGRLLATGEVRRAIVPRDRF
ncbi:MAG: hypothetical protein JNL54_15715 [Kineosporiaceae bacterium]|nr:hypothetical protein [Kineosporiaceae bacterium]